MKYLFLFTFIITSCIAHGQDLASLKANQSKAERIILQDRDLEAMMTFYNNSQKKKDNLITAIKTNANIYTPPVLFNMAMVLMIEKKQEEACFWFYVAQLRARYDVNRSVDTTVSAADWNQPIGLAINQYAFEHLETLKKVVPQVIAFVNANDELYDQRWINVLSGRTKVKDEDVDKLSVDKSLWPAIKKKTVDAYYSDFKTTIENYKAPQH